MSDRTGIYAKGNGWRAVIVPRRGQWISSYFPAGTPFSVMQAWRKDEKAKYRLALKNNRKRGRLGTDIQRYLALPHIKQTTNYRERGRMLDFWLEQLGDVDRASVTPMQIAHARGVLMAKDWHERKLAPRTVNMYVKALQHLYRTLDGKQAYNPVQDVTPLLEPPPRPRDIPADDVPLILAAMQTRGRAGKGETRPPESKSAARAAVLAATGLPSGTLKKLRKDDVDFTRSLLHLPARKKGTGAPGAVLPLSAEAVAAFRELDRLDAWGSFSNSSLGKSFKRAARAVTKREFYPYQLRHTFATQLAKRTGDETAVAYLLQHKSVATTRKYYTLGSHFDRAAHLVGQDMGKTLTTPKGENVENFGQRGTSQTARKHAVNTRNR